VCRTGVRDEGRRLGRGAPVGIRERREGLRNPAHARMGKMRNVWATGQL
jgi:hypothetical protein